MHLFLLFLSNYHFIFVLPYSAAILFSLLNYLVKALRHIINKFVLNDSMQHAAYDAEAFYARLTDGLVLLHRYQDHRFEEMADTRDWSLFHDLRGQFIRALDYYYDAAVSGAYQDLYHFEREVHEYFFLGLDDGLD